MIMFQITSNLKFARKLILAGKYEIAMFWLNDALQAARYHLPADVPRYRCLRAYIVQAINALEPVTRNFRTTWLAP